MAPSQHAHLNDAYTVIDTDLIQELLQHKNKGDRLMFMRSHNGQIKVKIKYGPLKCLAKRFVTNNATFEKIKQHIALTQ